MDNGLMLAGAGGFLGCLVWVAIRDGEYKALGIYAAILAVATYIGSLH